MAHDFATMFQALTGNAPFPWQTALYERLAVGDIPESCNLPTGLGKTNVLAVWLIALANGCPVPRRLVYVVNRRTVVDQTTDEAEKFQRNASKIGIPELAISTLRGQFADNRAWSADPSRPAIICGTVDMIGSRLLFGGYGIGFKGKPLHAGFLGQDVLLVHDEAHLEPAFQKLLLAIEEEQRNGERTGVLPWPKLRVMALTATPRGGSEVFELTPEEKNAPSPLPARPEAEEDKKTTPPIHHVWWRTHSKKSLTLAGIDDEKKELVPAIVRLALKYKDAPAQPAVLVFVRTVDAVNEVVKGLRTGKVDEKNGILTLTGTMRGYERDRMATQDKVFARFKTDSPAEKQPGTVYLVCTSAGEVGVDISADHMVCDLSTYDSMAQRFGRVNRYGLGDARIDIVHPKTFPTDADVAAEQRKENAKQNSKVFFDAACGRTLALLDELSGDGSPQALGRLDPTKRVAAFAPTPTILPTSDILFDAWALTTVKGKLPGRPPVEPYLHGLPTDWQPPETHVAWRQEVWELRKKFESPREKREFEKYAAELLDDYPLKPHELLREPSYRAFKQFEALAKRRPDDPAWLVDDDGGVTVLTVAELADKDDKDRINWRTVLLAPDSGGLESGMLNGGSDKADDVADECFADKERTKRLRLRVWEEDERTEPMRLVRRIVFDSPNGDDDAEGRLWSWFEVANEGGKSSKKPVLWRVHVDDVIGHTRDIVSRLPLGDDLRQAIIVAAMFHDHGKRRKQFQMVLGNTNFPKVLLAKSGRMGGRVAEVYRHEFGSLTDVQAEAEFLALSDDMQKLVLHLIAAHHGRARPHFPADEAYDPDHADTTAVAAEVPQRFAQLQRKYGRWGLAYLESLLRAADWAASANPSAFVEGEQ